MRAVLFAFLCLAACGGGEIGAPGPGPGPNADADGGTAPPPPPGSPDAGPAAPELGGGDHSPGSVDLVVELDGNDLHRPTALAFDPLTGRLWIVNQDDNSWILVDDVEQPSRQVKRFADDSAHFFDRPAGISFHGSEAALATCQESLNGGDEFMGPTAWTSDLSLFTGDGNSHYDMLHESGNCVGIVWTEAHVWWAFNGVRGALDRNDFHGWHPDAPGGLGGMDHSDGEIFRYADGELKRVAGVPAGMKHDAGERRLYVSDTGHGRVVAIDTTPRSGTSIDSLNGEVPLYKVSGVDLEQVIAPGQVQQPSGLELVRGLLFVADHASGVIGAYTKAGVRVNWLDTGLGAGHVTSLALSPGGKLHFLDSKDGKLYRIDPK